MDWRAALGLKLLVLADKHLIASYFPHNLSLLHKTETSLPIVWFTPGWQNSEFNRKHILQCSSMAPLFTFPTVAMLCSLVSSLGTFLSFPMQHLALVSAVLFEISWNLNQNHSWTDFGKHTSHTGRSRLFLKRCLGGWDEMMLAAAQSPLSRCGYAKHSMIIRLFKTEGSEAIETALLKTNYCLLASGVRQMEHLVFVFWRMFR